MKYQNNSRCCFYSCRILKDFFKIATEYTLMPCSLSWNMHTLFFVFLIPLPVPIQSQNRSFFVVLRPEAQDKKYDRISIMVFNCTQCEIERIFPSFRILYQINFGEKLPFFLDFSEFGQCFKPKIMPLRSLRLRNSHLTAQNWFQVKSEWRKNSKMITLCFSEWLSTLTSTNYLICK